jgi:hypothetical protein
MSDCREVTHFGEPFRLRVPNSKQIRLQFDLWYYVRSEFSRANPFIDERTQFFVNIMQIRVFKRDRKIAKSDY